MRWSSWYFCHSFLFISMQFRCNTAELRWWNFILLQRLIPKSPLWTKVPWKCASSHYLEKILLRCDQRIPFLSVSDPVAAISGPPQPAVVGSNSPPAVVAGLMARLDAPLVMAWLFLVAASGADWACSVMAGCNLYNHYNNKCSKVRFVAYYYRIPMTWHAEGNVCELVRSDFISELVSNEWISE